jgi:hypothetical protein
VFLRTPSSGQTQRFAPTMKYHKCVFFGESINSLTDLMLELTLAGHLPGGK